MSNVSNVVRVFLTIRSAGALLLIASIMAAQYWWRLPFEQFSSPADILSLILGLLLAFLAFLASATIRSGSILRQRVFAGISVLFLSMAIAEFILDAGPIDIPIALLWLAPGLVLALSTVATKTFGPARFNFLVGVSLQLLELARSVLATAVYGEAPEPAFFEWIESASDLLVRAFFILGFVETLRSEASPAIPPAFRAGNGSGISPLGTARRSGRIAIFMYRLSGGGAQRRSLTLANALASHGYEVDFVVLSGQTRYADRLSPAIRFMRLDSARWGIWHSRLHRYVPYRWIRVQLGFVALARYLREERPDVLVSAANRVLLTTVMGWRLAGRPMPLILRATNHPTANFRLWAPVRKTIEMSLGILWRLIYSSANEVVAVSNGVADEVHRLSGLPRERITTIFEPVVEAGIAEKCEAPLPHPWFAAGGPPVLVAVGRLRMQKDFPTLIKAFALVRKVRLARLVIIGEGRQGDNLQRLIETLGLKDDVALAGYMENPFAWMARASLYVLSSVWEGLPGVLIEALACGCPVVSTNCPSGPSEILDAGAYGRLVPCRDPEAMAEAILSTLDQPCDRQSLRNRAQAFSVEAAAERYAALIENCLQKRADAPIMTIEATLVPTTTAG